MNQYSIAFEYKLKWQKAVKPGASALFLMESPFIPVETLQIPVATDFGTISGAGCGVKNLIKIFDLYENIPLLVQGIFQLDMEDFVINAGSFIPEPAVSSSIDLSVNDYYLFYITKNS